MMFWFSTVTTAPVFFAEATRVAASKGFTDG